MNETLIFRVWLRTLITWAGILAFVWLAFVGIDWWFLLGSYIVYHVSMLVISVGNHRLFSHQAFKCNRFWHWFFALWGTAFGNGSSVQWVFVHLGHHLYSDTPKDPHQTNLGFFFRYKHKTIEYSIPRIKWMMRDSAQRVAHKYAMLIIALVVVALNLISFKVFVYFYLIPAAYQLITGGLFLIYSHNKDGAVDRYWLELLLPFTGEWVHKAHHDKNGSKLLNNAHKWYHIDYGYWFMKLISK